MKLKFYFVFLLLFFIDTYQVLSDSSRIYKLFGASKEHSKNALIFSPFNSEFENGTLGDTHFEYYLNPLGIKTTFKLSENMYDNSDVTIDDLINYFSGKGIHKYSIIYIFTHGDPDTLLIEMYGTITDRDNRLFKLNNDPRFKGRNYFHTGETAGMPKAYAIAIGYNFIKDFFKQNGSLVIIGACHAGDFGKKAFNPAGAVASIGWDQPLSVKNYDTDLGEEIGNLLCAMTGTRSKTISDNKSIQLINYSIGEIEKSGQKVLKTLSVWLRNINDGDYVIYQQPRINKLEIKSRKKGSTGTFDKIMYSYFYPGSSKFNPTEQYPSRSVLDDARKEVVKYDDELHVSIEFSKNIKISKEASSFEKASEGSNDGYKFKICEYDINKKQIFFDRCIDMVKDSLISYAAKIDEKTEQITDEKSDDTNKISMRFDLSDFNKEDNKSKLVSRSLIIVSKVIDSYNEDGMFYLDTNGSGREDGMTSSVVDGGREYEESDTNSKDGLDTNHWFWTAPAVQVSQSMVYNLHFPQVLPGEKPPSVPILQTLLSNKPAPIDWKKVNYLFARCATLPVWEKMACNMDATASAMKLLMPTFYLGPDLLPSGTATSPAAEPIVLDHYDAEGHSLEKSLQPVYVAIVKTIDENKNDSLVPRIELLARSDSFRDEVKLWLDLKPIIPNPDTGNNRLSSNAKKMDISNLYDIYLVKDAPDQALVVLPLNRLYKGDGAISTTDGSHTLRIETSLKGDEEAAKNGYESSQLLTYVKDFTAGYDAGTVKNTTASMIKDDGSGFNNTMLNYAYFVGSGKSAFINDMALNKIEIPSPKKDEKVDGSDNSSSNDTTPSSPSDENPNPPKICTQYTSLSCHREEVDACHYKRTCDSADFAICLLPFPYVTNPTNNTTWNVFKKNDISCENQEDYGTMGKFGAVLREGEPVEGEKKDQEEAENPVTTPPETTPALIPAKKENHAPVVTSIQAVRDEDSPTGVSLACTWEDPDDDVVPGNTRIFLVPDFDLNKFRELNLTADIEANRVHQAGCNLKNIRDLTEGKFGVKVHIEDEEANSTDEVRLLTVRLDPPKITDVIIDKDNMLVTAIVSDEGTPIDQLKLNFPVIYNFSYLDNHMAKFTVPIPPVDEKVVFQQFILKATDLAAQNAQKNFYRDIYPPDGSMKHIEDEKKLVTDIYDVDFESGIDITRADLVIDGVIYKNYKVQKAGDIYKIIFQSSYLTEGMHSGYVKACDYNNNCSQTKPETFNVAWPPEIYYFDYNAGRSSDPSYFEAKVWDKGKNLDPDGFDLKIDGQLIPPTAYSYDPISMLFYYYPPSPIPAGNHTAILTARDTTGLFDQETITFKSAGITNLILTNKVYRDIEGNGDGIINEAERIYIDLDIMNIGDAATQNVWGELISRSQYIKGVPEARARYGFIQPGMTASNAKPFEFVVNNEVFERDDIDRVEAEFVLRLTDSDIWTGKSKTTDLPFTLVIERMDPAMALFEISVVKPSSQTMEPILRLEGSWKTFGTDLKSLDIRITQDSLPASTARNSLAAFQNDLTVVKNDTQKTFYADTTLGIGENRFVVTATADNGVVRTAEVGVKLLSQVGVELDAIADTKDPKVVVTGNAWTVNSKLEKVEIYLNGGLAGDAVLDGGGRFSLPVTLNGGENMIRAVARDDQGKSAMDEIKINMHGPLTLRWQRANWRTSETPVAACGSYEVEGDDIASIVTYVNYVPNTYEVVIDRNLKTFCTTAGLQPGSNLLRAVGTTTGGITSDAYSRVTYQTGGVLSITLDPFPESTLTPTQRITGSFTLSSTEPYTITVVVTTFEESTIITEYTPIIDSLSHTFYVDVLLPEPNPYSNNCWGTDNSIEAYIYQGIEDAYYWGGSIHTVKPICPLGIVDYDYSLCSSGIGRFYGEFQINDPLYHVAGISVLITHYFGETHLYTVTDWDTSTGQFYLDINIGPGQIYSVVTTLTDNFGNSYEHYQSNICPPAMKDSQYDVKKPGERRKSSQRPEKERRIKKTEHE